MISLMEMVGFWASDSLKCDSQTIFECSHKHLIVWMYLFDGRLVEMSKVLPQWIRMSLEYIEHASGKIIYVIIL